MLTTTTPIMQTSSSSSAILHRSSTKSNINMKSSCSDLQSRLKVRKVLGVGDTAGSKISQILGHSDHLIFELPPKLTLWLFLTTTIFSCFTIMGLVCPSFLQFLLPGHFESTLHLATSYAFLATILALTLRSGDKNSLQLVLFALTLFHTLSCLVALWFLTKHDTKIKSIGSIILHSCCLLINIYYYRSIIRSVPSNRSHPIKKPYFPSLLSYPSAVDTNGHDSS